MGKHLAAGSSHVRSWSCNYCSWSSSHNWRTISHLPAQKETQLGRSTGDNCEDNNDRCHLWHRRLCCCPALRVLGEQLTYTAPIVTAPLAAVVAALAPYVTAASSQVLSHNVNGIATAPVIAAAPVAAHAVAKYAADPLPASLPYGAAPR
ncbi:uncharacterized protein LOC135433731 [Drosophila montana]|uniref:uncharacterized protein LOC135433731 n=1 Tax=Drosophila montana TaxID=40370 RepID=UPI00313F2867